MQASEYNENTHTQNFFENEALRIEKIFAFVQKKALVKEQYPQTQKIISQLMEEKKIFQEVITQRCLEEDSVFYRNVKKIFDFKKLKE